MLSAHGSLPNPVFQPYESGLQDVEYFISLQAWCCHSAALCGAAAGRLREGMMIGYDNERMKNLWPTKDMVPEYKYGLVAYLPCLCNNQACWLCTFLVN